MEPKLDVDEEPVAAEPDEVEEDAVLPVEPGVLDEEVVARLPPTREVAERNAAEPPPVCSPFVDVTEGVEDWEVDVDEDILPVLEVELPLLEEDIPPPPPLELDWRTEDPPPPPPPLRRLPPRPPPLRLPRS